MDYQAQQEAIAQAAAKFPETFGLRAFPGKVFTINLAASYYSSSEGVMLYTFVVDPATGEQMSFCKGSPEELQHAVVTLAKV